MLCLKRYGGTRFLCLLPVFMLVRGTSCHPSLDGGPAAVLHTQQGAGTEARQDGGPIDTTIYELLKWPERFDGKMVRVSATAVSGYEKLALKDGGSLTEIWLEINGSTEEPQAEYAFIKKPEITTGEQLRWTPFRKPVRLNRDDAFFKLFHYLGAKYDDEPGRRSWSMPKFTVSAVFAGRFDYKWERFRAFRNAARRITIRPGGFGHLYMYESQLVLESVSGVSAEPIERSVYGDRPL